MLSGFTEGKIEENEGWLRGAKKRTDKERSREEGGMIMTDKKNESCRGIQRR